MVRVSGWSGPSTRLVSASVASYRGWPARVDRAAARLIRFGRDILVRTDSAGSSPGFLAHIRGLREHGMRTFCTVGVRITEPVRESIGPPGLGAPRWILMTRWVRAPRPPTDWSGPDEYRVHGGPANDPIPACKLPMLDTVDGMRQ